MVNFDYLWECMGVRSPPNLIFQKRHFLCYILLNEQISLSDYLGFLRYWTIYVFQLFISQVATTLIIELTLST